MLYVAMQVLLHMPCSFVYYATRLGSDLDGWVSDFVLVGCLWRGAGQGVKGKAEAKRREG